MECPGKKRKGFEISGKYEKGFEELAGLAFLWSHFSLEDYSRRKKNCREMTVLSIVDSCRSVVNGAATAPSCGTSRLELPGRGLKRKIGCIDTSTRLGRKKKIDQDYDLTENIGQGKFGSVLLCRSKATGEEFACKTLQKGEEIVHREVEIMQHLSGHPGVVTLKAVYEDADSFHLVMELCSGGRLLDQMAKCGVFSEHKAAKILEELMLAVRYCHEMGVVHRDIKPENILLTASGQMKLADFGLAMRILTGQSLTGIVGSPAYVAPEILSGNYSEKVDIWSAGVLLHALLVGELPFRGDSLESIFEAIKKEKLDFNGGVWERISQPARDLLSRMLTRSTSSRLTANEVLKHPWISFFAEPSLKTLSLEPKTKKTHIRLPSNQLITSDDSLTTLDSYKPSEVVEGEDSGIMDMLAEAISHVRISEPKRSRICSPSRLNTQECSSNFKTSNLCAAF